MSLGTKMTMYVDDTVYLFRLAFSPLYILLYYPFTSPKTEVDEGSVRRQDVTTKGYDQTVISELMDKAG